MAEEKFYCAACGKGYEGNIRVAGAQECRVCYRIHCAECLDENGMCVPCSELDEKKGE